MPPLADILLLVSPLLGAALLACLALAAGGAFAARLVGHRTALADGPRPRTPAAGDRLERLALALALGLGLLGQALFLAALAGRFDGGALAAILVLTLVLGRRALQQARRDAAAVLARAGWHRLALGALAAAAVVGPAWLALYPPVAWDDAIYHLPLARSLVEHGRYVFVETLRVPVFPLLAETLFAPALLLGRDSTAHGVALVATFGTALLLLAWARARCGAPARSVAALAWMLAPAVIWIGQPIVVFYSGSAYVEPLLALFATAAALAVERWRSSREPRWLLAAGVFAGWAAATKYLGLYLVAALGLTILWEAARGTRLSAALRFAGAVTLAAGPWYALVWVLAGNPIFPFLPQLFGASEWSGITAVAGSGVSADWQRGALDLVRLGWDLVVARARTNAQPPASPWVIASLPLLLFVGGRQRWTRPWVAMIAGFAFAYLALPRDARYFMFLSPLLTLLLVIALRDLVDAATAWWGAGARWRTRAAVALVVLGVATGPAYALWRVSLLGPPPLSATAIDDHLARRLPLYRALLFRRAQGLDHAPLYALHGERLHAFGGAALLGDWSGPYRYELVLPLLDRPPELARELRQLGAGQLLLPRALLSPEVIAGIAASPPFRQLYADDEGVLLALAPPAGASGAGE